MFAMTATFHGNALHVIGGNECRVLFLKLSLIKRENIACSREAIFAAFLNTRLFIFGLQQLPQQQQQWRCLKFVHQPIALAPNATILLPS